jgi:hypothetical protein
VSAIAWRGRQIVEMQESLTRHSEARVEYLAARREAQSIENQIQALRELAKWRMVQICNS